MFVMSHHLLARESIYLRQKIEATDNHRTVPEQLLALTISSEFDAQLLKDYNDLLEFCLFNDSGSIHTRNE